MAVDLPSKHDWQEGFLAVLRETSNATKAARAVGISRVRAYQLKNELPEFEAEWENAKEEALDELEAAGRARAIKTSDTLMCLFLKAHRGEVYNKPGLEKTHAPPQTLEVVIKKDNGKSDGT